ncbi:MULTISPECIES: SDR family oxidoreductase [Acinetobacter]|uniref:SDR family oxidoreductase n=1 Tax=Acinetobacter TaxID=469 RepID=UPI0015D3B726|nr:MULTISPECIES: SDR family oxidoreductase [unclassified Acinetobacter]UIJ77557.1 SDR family oxidoreductase [Acinetobacter sp. SH20PTE14]
MTNLNNKVVLVTGGATHIGQAVVKELKSLGADVIIADINETQGRQVAAETQSRYEYLDLANDESIQALVSKLNRLDILVNLACLYEDHGSQSTRNDWQNTFNVTVFGHAALVQVCRPLLQASNDGAVINISSVSARIAQKERWVYPASKATLEQLTKSMALDLAADGIRVHALSLGWTWSVPMQMISGNDRPKTDRVAGRFHVLGRIADAEEVAEALSLLCSPKAKLLTGSVIHADGGYHTLGPEATDSPIEELSK